MHRFVIDAIDLCSLYKLSIDLLIFTMVLLWSKVSYVYRGRLVISPLKELPTI